jgi:hypothetical protein
VSPKKRLTAIISAPDPIFFADCAVDHWAYTGDSATPINTSLLFSKKCCNHSLVTGLPKVADRTKVAWGGVIPSSMEAWIPAILLLTTGLPAEAATGAVVPSALWAYAHYFSIIVIFGCLTAERTIVKAGMTEEEENTIVKLDLIYGLMAFLL